MENGLTHNVLPDRLKNHSMAQTRQYINYDEELGIDVYPDGFLIPRPDGGNFLSVSYFNSEHDPFKEMEERPMERGDILISSPIKTGSHWLFEIVSMLTRGSAEYDPLPREAAWIDVRPLKDVLRDLPKPRVLATHVPLSYLPNNFRRSDTKVVMSMRNLKDVVVSAYHHHIQKMPQPYDSIEQFNNQFQQLLHSRYQPFGNHFEAYADMWNNYRSDPNVIIVMYEQLKQNPEEVIKNIADHLEVSSSPSLIKEISEAVDIQRLKPAKYESEAMLRQKFGDRFSLFRTGDVGQWKEWFTVSQDREFHRKLDEWNKEMQIPFIYEL